MMHIRDLRLHALLTLAAFCGAEPAGAQLASEMKLEDAGFVMRRADTSQAKVLLSHLAGMPEFRDRSEIAWAHVSALREVLRPGGADLELRAR